MPTSDPKPDDYFLAAHRQYEIAEYHQKQLDELLAGAPSPDDRNLPPIGIQAHFEGVLAAFSAALDKYAMGIICKKAPNQFNQSRNHIYFRTLWESDPKVVENPSDLARWYTTVSRLKNLRNDVIHNFTTKTPDGKLGWMMVFPDGHQEPLVKVVKDVFEEWDKAIKLLQPSIAACTPHWGADENTPMAGPGPATPRT